MPSGAKKRKAAKKKKTSTTSSTSNSGDGTRKQYESDGGEVSDYYNSEYQLTEGEEEDVEKPKGETFSFEGKKTVDDVKNDDKKVEKIAAEKEGIVQIKGDSKQENEYYNKKRGSSKSSRSRSSSDDESRSVQKNVDSVKAVGSISEGPKQVSQTTHAEKVPLSNEKVSEGSGASAAKSLSSDVGGQKEIGEGKKSSLDAYSRPPRPVVPENKKDKKTNGAATSNAKEHAAHENEEKLMVSYNAPRDDALKDAERVKGSEVHGSSERQPLIASTPQPVKKTSWKSCCGLFEAFSGSNA